MLSIRKKDYDFLSGEINSWVDDEIINSEQAEKILSLYEIKARNLPKVLLTAGGILLFLGFVSFIAANWHELNKIFRVCIISSGYLISLASYIFSGKSETKTGKSFLLLASVIFGSGIFLITRMYDIKMTFAGVLGWWVIQVILTALITRDLWQIYLAQIIALIWMNDTEAINFWALQFVRTARVSLIEFFSPLSAFALIITLWLAWNLIHDRIAFIMNMFLTLLLLASRMSLCFGGTLTLIILVISGASMSFISRWPDMENLGLLMLGLFGLLLTWPEFWRGEFFASYGKIFAVINALIVAVLMIINIYRGHSAVGITFCVMLVCRYFFDHLFGYIPKAWGFTLTGIIFLFAGIYFYRKKS
ncbi:MAG: DUF2157 domain-containing protein [Synergistaceae bacterium]|nr:DUF2157 domain-containing protein [Synergistaceae bacterium]